MTQQSKQMQDDFIKCTEANHFKKDEGKNIVKPVNYPAEAIYSAIELKVAEDEMKAS